MFPLTTLTVLEAILNEVVLLGERQQRMNDEIKADLEQIKADQAATAAALDDLKGDITTLDGKVSELHSQLVGAEISEETKELLKEVIHGSHDLREKAEALASVVPDQAVDAGTAVVSQPAPTGEGTPTQNTDPTV